MSQAGIINTAGGPVPPAVPTSFVTDLNSPAIPIANVLNVLGNDTTANNNNGIQTDGSSGSNTLTVQLTNRLQGSGTTVGAVTADLITFNLGAVPGAYNIEAKVIGFNSTGPSSTGFTVIGTVTTTGAAATIVPIPDETFVDDVALITADIDFIASGNNFIVRATGVVGLSINWLVVANYVFVS